MQCLHTPFVSVRPPKLSVRNSQTSIAQKQTHLQRTSEHFDGESLVGVNIPLPSHVKSITSTSNPFVKHCLKLRHSSSYRQSHGSVLVVGSSPIRYVANSSLNNLIFVWVLRDVQFRYGIYSLLFAFPCLVSAKMVESGEQHLYGFFYIDSVVNFGELTYSIE